MAGRTKLALALGLAAVLAASVAACGGGGSGGSSASSASTTGSGPAAPTGKAREGSAGFVVPGGDNSIQNFGSEAPASEREAASRVLESYLSARAAKDFGAECAALARSAAEPLERLAASSAQGKKVSCAAALARLAGSRPAPVNAMTGPIGSLRVQGDRGFALYHGAESIDYVVPMHREGVVWKVGTLEPVELG